MEEGDKKLNWLVKWPVPVNASIGLQMSLPSQGPACPSYGKEVEGASLREKKKKKFETHRHVL